MQKTMIEKLEDLLVVINLVISVFSHMGPRTMEAMRVILEASIEEEADSIKDAISFLNGLGYYDRNTVCQSIYHLVEDGHLIPAVKLVRVLDHTMGLKEAKRTAQLIHKLYNQ